MNELEEVGRRIATARRANGLTQNELAVRLGVTRSAVAQWETGRAGQVTGTVARIAAALGLEIDQLLLGDDQRSAHRMLTAEETAMLRLFRACVPDDRQILLRTARRLAATD